MTVDDIVRDLAEVLLKQYQSQARTALLAQPKEWLVDELLARLPGPLERKDAQLAVTLRAATAEVESEADRALRRGRIRAWKLDGSGLPARVERLRAWSRSRLESERLLIDPPAMGGAMIDPAHRSSEGEALLREAKDTLYALLFEDGTDLVQLDRVRRELLTLTLPRDKSRSVAFMLRAATEINAVGTWQDPTGRANDEFAANTILQVEYGEISDEQVGHGIAASLRLINYLEVNEQVLYARMENVEESTLT
jgi:hypothetical protein